MSTDGDSDVVECVVCTEPLLQPVTLYCGHNLCLQCVNRITDYETVRCPQCRFITPVPLPPDRLCVNRLFGEKNRRDVERREMQRAEQRRRMGDCGTCGGGSALRQTAVCDNCGQSHSCHPCMEELQRVLDGEMEEQEREEQEGEYQALKWQWERAEREYEEGEEYRERQEQEQWECAMEEEEAEEAAACAAGPQIDSD